MIGETGIPPVVSEADMAFAAQIVADGVRRYFDERRKRIRRFVDRNFSLRGSIDLHRGGRLGHRPSAAEPDDGGAAGGTAARGQGSRQTWGDAGGGKSRPQALVVHTAVGKELAWRPKIAATRVAPSLPADPGREQQSTCGAAIVRFSGARAMSQPTAARCRLISRATRNCGQRTV